MDYSKLSKEKLIQLLRERDLQDAKPGQSSKALLETLPVAILHLSDEGRILFRNKFSHIVFAALSDHGEGYELIFDSPAIKRLNVKPAIEDLLYKGAPFDLETGGIQSGRFVRYFRCLGKELKKEDHTVSGYALIIADISERKLTASRYLERSYNYKALFDVSPNAILLADKNGVIIDVNPALYQSLGYKKEEVVGQHVRILAHPENIADVDQHIERILSGETLRHTVKSSTKSGRQVYMELHERRVMLDDNQYGFISVGRDISKSVLAEKRATEARNQLQAVIDSVQGSICWLDNELNYLGVNRNWRDAYGLKANNFVGKPLRGFVPVSRHFLAFAERFFSSNARKETLEFTDNIEGEERTTLLIAQKYAGGKAAVFVHIDVTENRRFQQQLEAERNFNRNLVETAPAVIMILEEPDTIVEINRFGLELGGRERHNVLNSSFLENCVPQAGRDEARDVLQSFFDGDVSQSGPVTEFVSKEKTTKKILWHGSPFSQSNSKKRSILVIGFDVTENLLLEEQLRHSQKMDAIGKLAGGIAHDFNNLIMIIHGYCELLEVDPTISADGKQKLGQIVDASDRAKELTSRLLSFSRRQVLSFVVSDINALVMNVVQMVERVIDENIEIGLSLEENLYPVKTDPAQMESVILNLVVNARDAMPDGGKIEIRTANVNLEQGLYTEDISVEPGKYARLSVSDTGKGISEDIRELIFEPFFTTKEVGRGTGLGLSMVYGFIRQGNGAIGFESEKGRGTTFNIYLPCSVGGKNEPITKSKGAKEATPSDHAVLVVEDDEKVRKLIHSVLQTRGFKTFLAKNGSQGLELFKQHEKEIQLVLTDVVMPGINGAEMIKKIKQINANIKVLFMSGYPYDIVHGKGLLSGNEELIKKPFTLDHLLSKINAAILNESDK